MDSSHLGLSLAIIIFFHDSGITRVLTLLGGYAGIGRSDRKSTEYRLSPWHEIVAKLDLRSTGLSVLDVR
jgi:hypothetical protein